MMLDFIKEAQAFMNSVRKKLRHRIEYLTGEEVRQLYRHFDAPPEHAEILIDAYHNHLPDKKLGLKHHCSKATLGRVKQTFWRRIEACADLVPGLVTPEVRNIIIKLLSVLATTIYIKNFTSAMKDVIKLIC